jgi:hypothetical protein
VLTLFIGRGEHHDWPENNAQGSPERVPARSDEDLGERGIVPLLIIHCDCSVLCDGGYLLVR